MSAPGILDLPLKGWTLVEAGAGTGKTWTIASLYLRLLLELNLPVSRILVLTFTEAATAQLRRRLRDRLAEVRECVTNHRGTGRSDPFLKELAERLRTKEGGLAAARSRLDEALRTFDRAAVHTIHGFCRRVLQESAFQSGFNLEWELAGSESRILRETAEDIYRRWFARLDPLFIQHLAGSTMRGASLIDPETWTGILRDVAARPYLLLEPESGYVGTSGAEREYRLHWREAQELWRAEAHAITALLEHESLSKVAFKAGTIMKNAGTIARLFGADSPSLVPEDLLGYFSAGKINRSLKKGKTDRPEHRFFEVCDLLIENLTELELEHRRRLVHLYHEFLKEGLVELRARRKSAAVASYDDLLTLLHEALRGPGGASLAGLIGRRHRALLVDEFQDTDPVQYAIFRDAFKDRDRPVYLVGDPKQAIYSFRGADIHTYLEAADAMKSDTLLLDRNFRSRPRLVEALNDLFGQRHLEPGERNPFLDRRIAYHEAVAADPETAQLDETTRLQEDGIAEERDAPLRIWRVDPRDTGKPRSRDEGSAAAARATAAEVSRLLLLGAKQRIRLVTRSLPGGAESSRPLSASHLAVLVRTNRQGVQVTEELLRLGISSVLLSRESVFHTGEAESLQLVLRAVADPGYRGAVKAALCTPLLGFRAEDIVELERDPKAWTLRDEVLRRARRIWRERGVALMLRLLIREVGISRRLLSLRRGERRLTNLLQLTDLLHREEQSSGSSMQELLQWFALQREDRGAADEERELRLESDDNLVRILTVHKSKGLEFPITFVPFLWHTQDRKKVHSPVLYHDPDRDHSAVLDLGGPDLDAHCEQARREAEAEELRLAYVALTRARFRTYFVAGSVRGAGDSPLARLLGLPRAEGAGAALDWRTALERLREVSAGRISVDAPPAEKPTGPMERGERGPDLQPRDFRGSTRSRWGVSSFSSLISGSETRFEESDHDALTENVIHPAFPDSRATAAFQAARDPSARRGTGSSVVAPVAGARHFEGAGIHDFPAGAAAGTCLHHLLETLDFRRFREARYLEEQAELALAEHGFDPAWRSVLGSMLERVLATPLHADAGCVLGDLDGRRRISELEFTFPTRALDSRALFRLLRARLSISPDAPGANESPKVDDPLDRFFEGLDFQRKPGYLRGFIDLVFEAGGRYHLADYKSNWLGPDSEHYTDEPLANEMISRGYVLQYLLYLAALHRHLAVRLPDYAPQTHLGGVYYIFLRGVKRDIPGSGVFTVRPPAELVLDLDRQLGRDSDE